MANLKDYRLQKTVKPQGLLKTSFLILKMYSIAKDEHPKNEIIEGTKNLLEKEINLEKIDPQVGVDLALVFFQKIY